MKRYRRRKCCHCKQLYKPDPRNRWHQKYCSQAACQKTSKALSQRRWTCSDIGRGYFKRPKHAQRVKVWRINHPGYWKNQPKKPAALQEDIAPYLRKLFLSGRQMQGLDQGETNGHHQARVVPGTAAKSSVSIHSKHRSSAGWKRIPTRALKFYCACARRASRAGNPSSTIMSTRSGPHAHRHF